MLSSTRRPGSTIRIFSSAEWPRPGSRCSAPIRAGYPGCVSETNPYEMLFAGHCSAAVSSLWGWQREVLEAYSGLSGDAAVELHTGTGKTLIGLLVGEHFRQEENEPVAYIEGVPVAVDFGGGGPGVMVRR